MIKLSKQPFNNKGVLQVKDNELEDFAYAQLKDYKKDYFKTVHSLEVEDFIENYLNIKIEYQTLSPNKSIFGMTAITDGIVPIINYDGKCDYRYYKPGTIIVDVNACNNKECLINSTLCHEAGHSQFDLYINRELINGNTYLSDTVIIDGRILKQKNDIDWMEHHANKYMTYLLMPGRFVRKLYKIKHTEIMPGQRLGVRQRKLIWKLVYAIAHELSVSASSMAWRMLTLGIISKNIFDALEISRNKEGL